MSTTIVRVVELISTNKSKAAFLAPLVIAICAAAGSWIVTGDWNDTEIRTAASGAVLGLGSAVATYVTPAGQAVVKTTSSGGVDTRAGERGFVETQFLLGALTVAVIVIALVVFL